MKLNANMYGADPTSYAEGIASDALTPSSSVDANYQGDTMPNDASDVAKGNRKDPSSVAAKDVGGGNDSRAKSKDNV